MDYSISIAGRIERVTMNSVILFWRKLTHWHSSSATVSAYGKRKRHSLSLSLSLFARQLLWSTLELHRGWRPYLESELKLACTLYLSSAARWIWLARQIGWPIRKSRHNNNNNICWHAGHIESIKSDYSPLEPLLGSTPDIDCFDRLAYFDFVHLLVGRYDERGFRHIATHSNECW